MLETEPRGALLDGGPLQGQRLDLENVACHAGVLTSVSQYAISDGRPWNMAAQARSVWSRSARTPSMRADRNRATHASKTWAVHFWVVVSEVVGSLDSGGTASGRNSSNLLRA